MKKIILILSIVLLFTTSGCVSRIETDVSTEAATSGTVYIDEISPNEAICIAKIVINDDISYSIEVTAESGVTITTALNMNDNVVSWQGTTWNSLYGKSENPYSATIPLAPIPEGVYYLYVGSRRGDELLDVNISVVGSGENAAIEFLK